MDYSAGVPRLLQDREEEGRKEAYELSQKHAFIYSEMYYDTWQAACLQATRNAQNTFDTLRISLLKNVENETMLPTKWQHSATLREDGVLAMSIGAFAFIRLKVCLFL